MPKTNLLKMSLPLGLIMLLLEGICNDAAKRANGGFMPVAVSKGMMITTAGRILMTATTRLNFLGDILRIHSYVFSIGDLLGFAGLLLAWAGIIYWGIVVARGLITILYSHYHIDNVI
jgi:hypothetical protein